MKLVERFNDFTHWPSSRKIFLLGCLSAPATLAAVLINHFCHTFAAHASVVDLDPLEQFFTV
ncbi:MAG: hypothetical protein ACRETW_07445 [Stenotrophobium sp.]